MNLRHISIASLVAAALIGPLSGGARADTRPTLGSTIVDATDKSIGSLLSPGYAQTRIDNVWVGYNVGPAGFMVTNDFALYYANAACSGQAWMDASTLPVKGSVMSPGNQTFSNSGTIFYPGLPVRQIHASSMMDASNICLRLDPPVPLTGGPMTKATLTGYVLPFGIK